MTEPVQFHTRGKVGLKTPTSTNNAIRPLMLMGRPVHTVHYTGLRPDQVWFSGGDAVFDTIDQVFQFMRRLEEVARASGKPFEYNTTIPVMSDNSSHVIAYADEYVAAHSSGENTIAHGTLFITGVNQPLNDGARLAFQWWNAVLEASGRLTNPSAIVPHNEMPGAATACPGAHIKYDLPILRTPYRAPTAPSPVPVPPVTQPKVEDLMVTIFKPSDCDAQFIGMTDKNGVALELEWIDGGSPKAVARRDAHWLAGAKVDEGAVGGGRFRNCNLIGPLPVGDTRHNWTAADFHKVRP